MADQTSGDAAPQGMETKTVPAGFHPDPNVVRAAPVPFTDSTHIDRGEGHQPAVDPPSADKSSESGTEQKTTSRRTSGGKSS